MNKTIKKENFVIPKIETKRVSIVLAPKSGDDYLPDVQTVSGLLYYAPADIHDDEGIVPEHLIPSLEREFTDLIGYKCNISDESSCLFFVSYDGCVYEVGMVSSTRRFLTEILPSGQYKCGKRLRLVGVIS